MSENPISISSLNDFVFCPVSIYFHNLESEDEKLLFQDTYQINGTNAHKASDSGKYSTRKDVLQGISVYSEIYNLCGKIDVFDIKTGMLTERKKKIKTIYDGYVFQLYAQCYSLIEMGYNVKKIRLYSMDDNKVYNIKTPFEDYDMNLKFQNLLKDMKLFNFDGFIQTNKTKCDNCIYEPLCSYSCLKG